MKVFCVGDSNTYGYDPRGYGGDRYPADSRWVDRLAARTGWTVCNLGENGRCIPLTPLDLPADADLLIVMLGTNDLLQGASPAAAVQTMQHFLQSLSLPRQNILLVAPPPMCPGAWVSGPALIEASRALAVLYRALAQRMGIRFADAGLWKISLAYDGVHFTGQGHRDFAAGLLTFLQPLMETR